MEAESPHRCQHILLLLLFRNSAHDPLNLYSPPTPIFTPKLTRGRTLPQPKSDQKQVLILKGPDKGRTAVVVGIVSSRNQAVVRVGGNQRREMRVLDLADIARQLPDKPMPGSGGGGGTGGAGGGANLTSKK